LPKIGNQTQDSPVIRKGEILAFWVYSSKVEGKYELGEQERQGAELEIHRD